MAIFIIENYFCTTYSEVLNVYTIYLMLPVTVISAELTFSMIKLLKTI